MIDYGQKKGYKKAPYRDMITSPKTTITKIGYVQQRITETPLVLLRRKGTKGFLKAKICTFGISSSTF